MSQTANIARAFLHGLTGAGLFRRLTYPGAPEEFIDSRAVSELEESGEFLGWIRDVNPDLAVCYTHDRRSRQVDLKERAHHSASY